MLPFPSVEEAGLGSLADDDHQLLLRLVQRYGVATLLCALTSLPDSCKSPTALEAMHACHTASSLGSRPILASAWATNTSSPAAGASTVSANTLLSNVSAPSLAWTSSDASLYRSDDGSVHTPCTWLEPTPEMQPMRGDGEASKSGERSWLDSPVPVPSPSLATSDVASQSSPRLVALTSKKYQCPMCYLDNSPVGFGRKSDFKKHLHNFHSADVVWICRTKGCHLSFSTERAYSTHAKEVHRMKALPNSAARTELCTQLVFACGFAACKDRIFEARTAEAAPAIREKYFEHIAKHFEEGLDVGRWEYRIQMQNLMRQPQIKSIWKSCIWPKEKRQQLVWRPRSSGDLKRLLESRHLGNLPTLVRLAYILGTAPFTAPATPPPSDIEMFFQLPHRALCSADSGTHLAVNAGLKMLADGMAGGSMALPKSRSSITQAMFRLPSRQGKRAAGRPARRPAPVPPPQNSDQVMLMEEPTNGPHPGTPLSIPNEAVWPLDAPQFAPEAPGEAPKQWKPDSDSSPPPPPLPQPQLQQQQQQQHQWATQPKSEEMWCGMEPPFGDGYNTQAMLAHSMYDLTATMSESPHAARPATPVPPHKRPASWGRVVSMESLRPNKKAVPVPEGDLMDQCPPCPPATVTTMLGM